MTETISLDDQIGLWRGYLRHRQAIHPVDVTELEDHLREEITRLANAGLSPDEAFLVAVKRIGSLDALSREFAREHSERLWKQLVLARAEDEAPASVARHNATVAFSLATLAAIFVKLPVAFGATLDGNTDFYTRNAALFVLPLLTGYFAWKRLLPMRTVLWLAIGFVVACVVVNAFPFASAKSATEALAAVHLPIALWLAVGIAYAGGRWREVGGRMDFVRFSGELFIYYVLIALGGAVLCALMAMIFEVIGVKADPIFDWIVPPAAAAAVIVAAWLVEAKQSVIENMAPVLTRLFTPLLALVLLAFLGAVVFTGHAVNVDRNVLIAFDLVLVLVVCLLLYAISARDPQAPPGPFDAVQLVLVVAALLADLTALWAIAARIGQFGFTPNRVAALGENVVLLGNLAWAAVLSARFLRGRGSFGAIERWQTTYLPIYAAWAAIVVVAFPPIFHFI